MMTECEVTEAAVRLCLHLEVRMIPEDFRPAGDYQQVMALVVNQYTNYEDLQNVLPDCPADCPIAAGAGEQVGAECFNCSLSRDVLRTEARRRALAMFAMCQPWPRGLN